MDIDIFILKAYYKYLNTGIFKDTGILFYTRLKSVVLGINDIITKLRESRDVLMSETTVTIVVALVGSGIGGALIGMVGNVIMFKLNRSAAKEDKKGEKEQNNLEKWRKDMETKQDQLCNTVDILVRSQMIMMQDRIRHLGIEYIKKQKIDVDDRHRLHIMHQSYHDLGGNGDLDLVMRDVDNLPLKDEN